MAKLTCTVRAGCVGTYRLASLERGHCNGIEKVKREGRGKTSHEHCIAVLIGLRVCMDVVHGSAFITWSGYALVQHPSAIHHWLQSTKLRTAQRRTKHPLEHTCTGCRKGSAQAPAGTTQIEPLGTGQKNQSDIGTQAQQTQAAAPALHLRLSGGAQEPARSNWEWKGLGGRWWLRP